MKSDTAGVEIGLAAEEEDGQLADILSSAVMPGRIAVSARCEQGYYAAARMYGGSRETIVGRAKGSGKLVGFCEMTTRAVFLNGTPQKITYVSALRVLEEYRSFRLFGRGVQYYRKLKKNVARHLHLGAIADNNNAALKVLATGRAFMPKLQPRGRYRIAAVPVHRWLRREGQAEGITIRQAVANDLEQVIAFLHEQGPARQFFPCYSQEDFFGQQSLFQGLRPEDLLLAYRGDRLVGTLAGWDQSSVRQTVLEYYTGALKWFRRPFNVVARLIGYPTLPLPGSVTPCITAALHVVENNEIEISATLLRELLYQARNRRVSYVLIGMHEADPLLEGVVRLGGFDYYTNVFTAHLQAEDAQIELDSRPPYLELGSI